MSIVKRKVGDFMLVNEIYDTLVAGDYPIKELARLATQVLGKKVTVLSEKDGFLEVSETK